MSSNHIFCANGDSCKFASEISRLRDKLAVLSEMVSIDDLTGLFNHRYFSQVITQEFERSQRTGQPTTLIMLDVDHFKKVNDKWGHEVGNQALKLISNCIKRNIRKLDIACRYGGEEFAVILPSTELKTSILVAERIRESIENVVFMVGEREPQQHHPLTISLGVSSHTGQKNDSWQHLVERADSELYSAKQSGRNKVSYRAEETTKFQVTHDEKVALMGLLNSDD